MRTEMPVRPGTLVFVGICLFAIAVALVGPVWIRMGSFAFHRFAEEMSFGPERSRDAMLDGVITYQQQRSLSCEYASLHIATTMLGQPVSEYAFDDLVPLDENPHVGYRGSIVGSWGNTNDYGVYNEPLAAALPQVGFAGFAFYGDQDQLKSELNKGRPVVVWLGFWGGDGSFDDYDATGQRYQLTPGMHVLVVYGYDDSTVFLTDPGNNGLRAYSWGEFTSMWNVMDQMALSVYRP